MSAENAIIGLTFRSVDTQDVDGLFLEIAAGLDGIPEVRGTDVVVPGLAGRVPRNRIADRLPLELVGFVTGDDGPDFRANVQAMQTLFDPTLDPGDLVATLEDGSTATISARTLNILLDLKTSRFEKLSIGMESVDPAWVVEPAVS